MRCSSAFTDQPSGVSISDCSRWARSGGKRYVHVASMISRLARPVRAHRVLILRTDQHLSHLPLLRLRNAHRVAADLDAIPRARPAAELGDDVAADSVDA